MAIVKSVKERLRAAESENRRLKAELAEAQASLEYIAICDHPEMFEEEEEVVNE